MNIYSMNNNSFTNLNETVANAYQEGTAETMDMPIVFVTVVKVSRIMGLCPR